MLMRRPGEVTAIAVYHALFTAVLVATLAWQAIQHAPIRGWKDAAPVLAMMLFISLIPAVICVGLWLMDNGARLACLIFTLLHMMITIAYLRRAAVVWRPCGRIAIDAGIVVVLMLPRIRRAFEDEHKLILERM